MPPCMPPPPRFVTVCTSTSDSTHQNFILLWHLTWLATTTIVLLLVELLSLADSEAQFLQGVSTWLLTKIWGMSQVNFKFTQLLIISTAIFRFEGFKKTSCNRFVSFGKCVPWHAKPSAPLIAREENNIFCRLMCCHYPCRHFCISSHIGIF